LNKYLISIFLFCSILLSQSILHENVIQAIIGNEIELKIYVDSSEREISNAILMYKSESQHAYLEQNMIQTISNQFIVNIPANYVENSKIYYYFIVTFIDNGVISYPFDSAYENPLVIDVKSSTFTTYEIPVDNRDFNGMDRIQHDALIISPIPNSTVLSNELVVMVSFFKMKNIDLKSVRLFFDDFDITEKLVLENTHITCPYPSSLKGRHQFKIEMKDKFGQSYDAIIWEFNVRNPEKIDWFLQLIERRGRIWSSYSNTNTNSLYKSKNELNLRYSIDLDWINIRLSSLQSSLEDPFLQTKNRYTINFKTNDLNISIGDFFPQINKYSLNGNKVRGLGAKASFSLMDFNFVKGTLLHVIQGNIFDNAMVISEVQLPEEGNNGIMYISRDNYSFRREVLGLNFGLGIPDKIKLNIDLVKIKDNLFSVYNFLPGSNIQINNGIINEEMIVNENYFFQINETDYIKFEDLKENFNNIMGDSYDLLVKEEDWEGVNPKDNLLIGSNFFMSFDKQKVKIKTGFTFSLLNRNIWDSLQNIAELDTMMGDSLLDGKFMGLYDIPEDFLSNSDIFEFGVNQVPLIPIDISEDVSVFSKILNLPSMIYDFETMFNYAGHNFKYKFLKVGSEFNSLANPYIQTDIREKIISDRVRILENRLLLNLKWIRRENGINKNNKNTIFINRYETSMGLYPGAGLPTINIGITSIHRKSEKKRIDEIIITNITSGEDTTIITDERLETLSKRINIALSNTFSIYGENQFSINFLISDKDDLVFKKKLFINPDYYSPQTHSTNININVYSKHSDKWESNLSLSSSSYSTGFSTDNHPEYFQKQNVMRLGAKLIAKNKLFSRKLSFSLNYINGIGTASFEEYNCSITGAHEIFNSLDLSWNYGLNMKKIDVDNKQINTSFRAKLLYKI